MSILTPSSVLVFVKSSTLLRNYHHSPCIQCNVSETHPLRCIHVTGAIGGGQDVNTGDNSVSITAPTKIAPLQHENYNNNSWIIPRHQIVPRAEKIDHPGFKYNPSKTRGSDTHQSRDNGEKSQEFQTGIPYALQLKMSRRRRARQRRKRRVKEQEDSVLNMSYSSVNSSLDSISVQNIHLGPQKRLRQQTPHVSVDRNSAVQVSTSNTSQTATPGIEMRNLNVQLAQSSPIQIGVQPSPRNEAASYGGDFTAVSDPEVRTPARIGPAAHRGTNARKRQRRRRRRKKKTKETRSSEDVTTHSDSEIWNTSVWY